MKTEKEILEKLETYKDDRGEDIMDIKAGMIIKYRNVIQASEKLGEVIEVNVVVDHKDKSLIGQKHYMVSELDRTLLNTRVEESEIVEVYEKVRSPWAE